MAEINDMKQLMPMPPEDSGQGIKNLKQAKSDKNGDSAKFGELFISAKKAIDSKSEAIVQEGEKVVSEQAPVNAGATAQVGRLPETGINEKIEGDEVYLVKMGLGPQQVLEQAALTIASVIGNSEIPPSPLANLLSTLGISQEDLQSPELRGQLIEVLQIATDDEVASPEKAAANIKAIIDIFQQQDVPVEEQRGFFDNLKAVTPEPAQSLANTLNTLEGQATPEQVKEALEKLPAEIRELLNWQSQKTDSGAQTAKEVLRATPQILKESIADPNQEKGTNQQAGDKNADAGRLAREMVLKENTAIIRDDAPRTENAEKQPNDDSKNVNIKQDGVIAREKGIEGAGDRVRSPLDQATGQISASNQAAKPAQRLFMESSKDMEPSESGSKAQTTGQEGSEILQKGSANQTMGKDAGLSQVWQLNQNTSETASAAKTTPGANPDFKAFEIIKQVATGILSISKADGREIRLQLMPEQLGKVLISIDMKGDTLSGRIGVENETTRQVVESNLGQLREALESQNVKLGSLEVTVNRDQSFMARQDGENGKEAGTGKRRDNANQADKADDTDKAAGKGDTGRRLGFNTIEYLA